jgi:hypothetical protein
MLSVKPAIVTCPTGCRNNDKKFQKNSQRLSRNKRKKFPSYESRSLEQMEVLAHLRCGFCEGCQMDVVDVVTDPSKQVPLFDYETGGKPPGVTAATVALWANKGWKVNKKPPTWLEAHFGKRYGVPPLVKIEPSKWAICILHCNLRIVGALFKKTILENLTNKPGDVSKAQSLYNELLANGIPIDPISQTSNCVSTYYDSISQHGFAGEDCSRLLLIYPQLLEIIFPSADRKSLSRSDQTKIDGYHIVWQYWASYLWPLINTKIGVEGAAGKAEEVRKQGATFCDLWVQSFGSSKILYLHLLSIHLPDQIENFPVDPLYFSLQGLEHANKKRKQYKSLSNCHKTTKTVVIPSFVTRKGTTVPEHQRSTGPAMCEQLLSMVIIDSIIEEAFTGSVGEQQGLEYTRLQNVIKSKSVIKTCYTI